MFSNEESLTALMPKNGLFESSIFYGNPHQTTSMIRQGKEKNSQLFDLESESSEESESESCSSKNKNTPLEKKKEKESFKKPKRDSNFIHLDAYRAYFVKIIFKNEIMNFMGNNNKVKIQAKYNGVQITSINENDIRFIEVKRFLEELECIPIQIHISSLYGLKFYIALQELKGPHVLFKSKHYIQGKWEVIFIIPKEIKPKERSECLKIVDIAEKHNFHLKTLFFDFEEIRCINANTKLIEQVEVLNLCKLVQSNFEILKKKAALPIFQQSEISWYLTKADNEDLISVNNVLLRFPNTYRVSQYNKELDSLENKIKENQIYFSFEIYDCDLSKDEKHYTLLAFKALEQNENFIFSYSELLTKICFVTNEKKLKKDFFNEYFQLLRELRKKNKCDENLCSKDDLKTNMFVTKIILFKKSFNIDTKKKLKEIEKFYHDDKEIDLKIDRTINDWENSSFLYINSINLLFSDAWKFLIKIYEQNK